MVLLTSRFLPLKFYSLVNLCNFSATWIIQVVIKKKHNRVVLQLLTPE